MAAPMTAILSLLFLASAQASTFLGAHPQVEMQSMSVKEVEELLLADLSHKSDARLGNLISELRGLFTAMPKNTQGKLDPTVVRYALHRYFARKHGWHLRGLEPAGGSWNSTSSSTIMKDRAPSYIQSILEQRLSGQGLGLEELAVFALTLSDLIRNDAVSDLEDLYTGLRLSPSASLSIASMDLLFKTYFMTYIRGVHPRGMNPDDFKKMEEDLVEDCITWFEAKAWVLDLRPTLDYVHRARRNPFVSQGDFHRVAEVVQEVGHRFGAFQNLECQSLKHRLVDMEHRGSGRVLLSKFYSGIEDRDWPFIESTEYLRNLGALDDTDPSRPAVIIPNFLSSPSNCVAPSSFYSVCCMDECEGLLAHVEQQIAEPSAAAPRLAEVISSLESDTVEAPRNLSSVQRARLDEIAAMHGGRIPLHGRLFAQWMHHAYPRECRFPHVAGTTQPLNQQDFQKKYGLDHEASDEEISLHLNGTSTSMETLTLPWMDFEELIAAHSETPEAGLVSSSCTRVVLVAAAVLSAAFPMVAASRQSGPGWHKQEKYLV